MVAGSKHDGRPDDAQGNAVDLGGYFRPDAAKADAVMRPVAVFNELLEAAGV